MPLLSCQLLHTHRELRLAHLALGVMTMGYVWQEGEKNTVEVTLVLTLDMLTLICPQLQFRALAK